jgi:hypothetical protein
MKIASMQPYVFPYLGYFQLIGAVNKLILYGRVKHRKQSWITRNYILDSGTGRPMLFVIPVDCVSSRASILDIRIKNEPDWRRKILKKIFLNYKRATHFDKVYPLLESIVHYRTEFLFQFNCHSIVGIAAYLKIPTPISVDEPYLDELENRLEERTKHFPDFDEKEYPTKTLRIIELCKREKADVYYNAIGGMDLYDKKHFERHGIQIGFLKSRPTIYKQYRNRFVPNLSIIDVMMFVEADEIKKMLSNYDII